MCLYNTRNNCNNIADNIHTRNVFAKAEGQARTNCHNEGALTLSVGTRDMDQIMPTLMGVDAKVMFGTCKGE